MTSRDPAATAACGYATSVIAFPKRNLFPALHSRPLPPVAIPGRSRRDSRGRKTCPPKRPLQPCVVRQPARARVRRSAGPDLRGHAPNAGQRPTMGPPMGSVTRRRHSESLSVRMLRCATGPPLPSTFGLDVPPRPPILPVRPVRAGPARSESRVWHHGGHSRAKRGSVVRRRPCSVHQAGTAGPRQ